MKKQADLSIDFLSFRQGIQTTKKDGKTYILDPIRKKQLVLLPEELVRQLVIQYLLLAKQYNKNRISIEKGIKVNDLSRRCDILVYDQNLQPFLLVECKAPEIPVTQKTFSQIARYNLPLKVDYLLVTNGRQTYCCKMDYEKESFEFLDSVPDFR